MNFTPLVGFAAALLGTIAFLPQAIKCWQTKHTKDISFPTYIILGSAVFLWTIYGLLIKDIPVIMSNSIAFIIVSSILIMKMKFG